MQKKNFLKEIKLNFNLSYLVDKKHSRNNPSESVFSSLKSATLKNLVF